MEYLMWSYPWDLLDLDIDHSLKEIASHGLSGLSIATSYHAGRFLQPRSPKRMVYFPEDGTLYFPFEQKNYRELLIQPREARIIGQNEYFWNDVFESATKYHLSISGWTVCLHNTRIGMAYPEVTVKNAFGDPYYYNLCPSHPEVRNYMKTMIGELSVKYPFRSLELESLNYMGYPHEFHHEKDGVGLTNKEQFLLSLCFCDACKKRARLDGIDISFAQNTVKKWLMNMSERELPFNDDEQFTKQGLEFFKDYPEVYAFLKWRSTIVTSLVKEIKEVIPDRIAFNFLSLLTPNESWLFGIDFSSISKICDGIVVCCYDTDSHQVGKDIQESRLSTMKNANIYAGLRLFFPEVKNEQAFIDKVSAAKANGSDGFFFYNYGLIPQQRLNWIKKAINNHEEQE